MVGCFLFYLFVCSFFYLQEEALWSTASLDHSVEKLNLMWEGLWYWRISLPVPQRKTSPKEWRYSITLIQFIHILHSYTWSYMCLVFPSCRHIEKRKQNLPTPISLCQKPGTFISGKFFTCSVTLTRWRVYLFSYRLSIRNLPTQVDEKQLKSLFLKAAGGPPAMFVATFTVLTTQCHLASYIYYLPLAIR